jgi:diguanylate cyclase (GGDEF)-like protein
MQSESTRLLRQWWDEPGDYLWVVEFLRPRGFLPGLKGVIGASGLLMGICLLCLLSEHLVEPRVVSHGLVTGLAVGAFTWPLRWWFFPWPSARLSKVLIFLADIGIVIATLVHADPLAALSTAPQFAVTGAYIVFFHGPRFHAVHVAIATLTILAAAILLAVSDQPDAVPLAIAKALIALIVTAGIFPFLQFAFWLVRSNSVESLTDPLTDLANRRGLANYLTRKINRLTSSSEPLCALVIDLDGFKRINDEHGHHVGDAVIVRTGQQIRAEVGPSAFVARTGGEEFVVVESLPLPAAVALAERIRAAIEAPITPRTSASIGVAVDTIADITEFEAIHARADEAMYVAKRDGGNRMAIDGSVTVTDAGGQPVEIPLGTTRSDGHGGDDTEPVGLEDSLS